MSVLAAFSRPPAVIALFVAANAGMATEFAATLPDGVSDVTGWEVVSGEFEAPGLRGDYRFYVNPRRQAIYQLMRFRTAAPGGAAVPLGAERVAFVRRPGTPEPLLCWQRQPAGTVPEWRAIAPGSAEYASEMSMLLRVLAIHRIARSGSER